MTSIDLLQEADDLTRMVAEAQRQIRVMWEHARAEAARWGLDFAQLEAES